MGDSFNLQPLTGSAAPTSFAALVFSTNQQASAPSAETLEADSTGVAMFGHMHLRGRDMTFRAYYPDGKEEVLISVDATPNFFRISVTDHGPGIPPEGRSRLFKKFSRLQRSVGGMGLGLYISRGIARAHGGDLTFEAPDEGGSRFVLSLPR